MKKREKERKKDYRLTTNEKAKVTGQKGERERERESNANKVKHTDEK